MYNYINRTMCEALEEMRNLDKTKNYSMLLSLVEEIQCMGNRMEAALSDKRDVERMREKRNELKKEIKELKKQKEELGEKDNE